MKINQIVHLSEGVAEGWSQKYKSSINCSHPKGFSQKAHCAGKKKHNESIEMEMVCEDCGMCETHGDHENLDEACWKGYHKEGNKKMFGKTYPNCVKNTNEEQEQHSDSCPHCGGELVSEELINEKKDACYYKVKSRYKVWPSAYASGALVKCRKKGAGSWGNGSKNEGSILEGIEQADESLHDWFNKEKWVRMDTKGNIKGPCAKEPGEGKPKCLPQAKAHSLGKKGRASAASRKRREDPNPERSGKAINVNTKKEKKVTEMDNRTPSGDHREKRANSPELRLPEPKQGVAEAAKWRTQPDAHDLDTDGSYIPKGGIKSDNLAIRQKASKTQSEKDPKSMAGMFGAKYAKKHGVPTKQLMKNIPLDAKKKEQGVAEGSVDKKPYPKTWHDVDPKIAKLVDKMSPEEKVKKGYSNPSILKKKKEQGVVEGQGSIVDKCASLAAKYFNSAGLQQQYDIDEFIKINTGDNVVVDKCASLAAKYFNSAGLQQQYDIGEYIKANVRQGVAEQWEPVSGYDTIYPRAKVIKSKNGKPIGEVYQDTYGWGCFHYKADNGADGMSSKEEALEQLKDMHTEHRQQGVAEGSLNELSSDLLKRSAQAATDKRNQAMDPELHNALGGGYMNPLATHYDNVSQKMDNRAAQVRKKETIQKIASKIASPAVMRKMGMSYMEEGVAENKLPKPYKKWAS